MGKKVLLCFICVLSLVCVLSSSMAMCSSATMTKETTKRVIGIVFDNSGSMYLENNTAWSQAQYAMEVFASMMNAGDEFIIYPMHPITVGKGGQQYTADKPYSVKDASSANTIRNIYTPKAAGTPGKSTIQKALKSLNGKQGEKWLIVLTDGEFDDADLSQQASLITSCLKSVNVLYLAMSSEEAKLKAPAGKPSGGHVYSGQVAATSDKVPGMLTQMCNKVFGRDELPAEFINGDNFTVDIPMSKVYVFVQGKNISNIQLSGNGKSVTATKVLNPCYGTNGGFATYDNEVYKKYDASLQGCLTVFENLDACKDGGKYSVKFSGKKSSMSIYYEPNVNLVVQMVNPDGTVCMEDQIFTTGDYALKYFLADDEGRELNSKLLGKTSFEINYTLNGESKTEQKSSSGQIPIHLDSNGTLAVDSVNAEILSGYRLQKTGDELGFLAKGIKGEKGAAGDLKMVLTGGQSSYDPDKMADTAKYKATFTYNGEKITGEALSHLKLNCKVQGDMIQATSTQTEDGFDIVLNAPKNLASLDPGKYVLNCSGTFTTEDSKDAYARADAEFTINDISGNLVAKIEADRSYFVKKDLKTEKLLLKLSLNGKPLTDEQLKNAQVEANTKLPVVMKPLFGESAYEISFDTKKPIETGESDLAIKVSNVRDRLDNNLIAEDSMAVTVGTLARWLKFLLWLLGLLLLAALLWYICTRPALPRKFESVNGKLTYLGNTKECYVVCQADGNHKEKIINYSCDLDRNGPNESVTFSVVPDKTSYWIKPSAKRKALIVPDKTTADVEVGAANPPGVSIKFENGDLPQKLMEKLQENGPVEFDSDGKFKFSGQTKKGAFLVVFQPEIK